MNSPNSKNLEGEKNLQNFIDHLARMIAKAHVLKQHSSTPDKLRKSSK